MDRRDSERGKVLEDLHPEMKFARLRSEALDLDLKPDDLKKRLKQIDEEEHPQRKGFQTAGAADQLHDMLQQAVMNDPKQAQRDDWIQSTAKAVESLDNKISAPPPGQPNPWQFVA